jgi:nucleoside-diphosphate-sugar epimerase
MDISFGYSPAATELFLARTDAQLTLYLRKPNRLRLSGPNSRTRVVEGGVLDRHALEAAMEGQDIVYAHLAGQLEPQARAIVSAMDKAGIRRLIFISSMGIYDEVPGKRFGSILDPYRRSAEIRASRCVRFCCGCVCRRTARSRPSSRWHVPPRSRPR